MKKFFCRDCGDFTWFDPNIHVCLDCQNKKIIPTPKMNVPINFLEMSLDQQCDWIYDKINQITSNNNKGLEAWA